MPLSADSLNEALLKYTLRAEHRYKQGVERIKWEHEVLRPMIEKMKSNKGVLGLPDGVTFEFVIEDANQAPSQTAHPDGSAPAADADGPPEGAPETNP